MDNIIHVHESYYTCTYNTVNVDVSYYTCTCII